MILENFDLDAISRGSILNKNHTPIREMSDTITMVGEGFYEDA